MSHQIQQTKTMFSILIIISVVHLINDSIQSVIPALNPIFASEFHFSYTQLGWIAFALNMTSSIFQPLIGALSDRKPSPYTLPIGMLLSFSAMIFIRFSESFAMILIAAVLIGLGSAIFHPEGSRVVALSAGKRRGLAQSIFQVGGNTGQALAPLFMILLFVPFGLNATWFFAIITAIAIFILLSIARWLSNHLKENMSTSEKKQSLGFLGTVNAFPLKWLILLLFLVFARSWYYSGIVNFYALYQVDVLHNGITNAQSYVFVFLIFGAIGTFLGGPLSDKIGRKNTIVLSMLGSLPFAVALPFCGPALAYVVIALDGLILLSSFSVTVVYAQDLLPGKIGTVSGLVIGLAFGMGAIGAVALGILADHIGLQTLIFWLAILPLAGWATLLLPNERKQ